MLDLFFVPDGPHKRIIWKAATGVDCTADAAHTLIMHILAGVDNVDWDILINNDNR